MSKCGKNRALLVGVSVLLFGCNTVVHTDKAVEDMQKTIEEFDTQNLDYQKEIEGT